MGELSDDSSNVVQLIKNAYYVSLQQSWAGRAGTHPVGPRISGWGGDEEDTLSLGALAEILIASGQAGQGERREGKEI